METNQDIIERVFEEENLIILEVKRRVSVEILRGVKKEKSFSIRFVHEWENGFWKANLFSNL